MDIQCNSARAATFSKPRDLAVRIGSPDGPWPVVTVATVLGRRVFDAVPEAVAEARRWLRAVVGDGCPDAPECLSEVFTNSVRHSRSGARREGVSVAVLGIRSAIRVEVTDAGGPTRPRLLPLDEGSTSGRGLYLVNELTGGQWGWHNNHRHRTVWFTLPQTGP
jgi:anti-sigma regulatory factor (Ser/Thr protein kinase)